MNKLSLKAVSKKNYFVGRVAKIDVMVDEKLKTKNGILWQNIK